MPLRDLGQRLRDRELRYFFQAIVVEQYSHVLLPFSAKSREGRSFGIPLIPQTNSYCVFWAGTKKEAQRRRYKGEGCIPSIPNATAGEALAAKVTVIKGLLLIIVCILQDAY